MTEKFDRYASRDSGARMNIETFLLARMSEAKLTAERIFDEDVRNGLLLVVDHVILIIDWHQNWPVLLEQGEELNFEQPTADINQVAFRITKRIAWVTNNEYRKRFGEEPPTAPLLRQIAQDYNWHPDYDPEWEI